MVPRLLNASAWISPFSEMKDNGAAESRRRRRRKRRKEAKNNLIMVRNG